ncbi:hypothetical protein [Paracoccus sp. (in: a-proteobacteria)]|uniref:hypothetical protein n=1 Tax=Paracoccus sp. TaxID=267 RepID=UPI003A84B098
MDRALREGLMIAVDDVWSETVRHLPLAGGRRDPDRDVIEITAVLRTGEREVEPVRLARGGTARPGQAADGGYLRIDRAAHAALVIRKGDKVVALDRDGHPVFEVLSVDDRSHLRLICALGDAS